MTEGIVKIVPSEEMIMSENELGPRFRNVAFAELVLIEIG